jgi:hypothetical protein
MSVVDTLRSRHERSFDRTILRPVLRSWAADRAALGAAATFAFAFAVGTYIARPFAAASIAYDSQASTVHFARIVEGRHLEAFISTTPKPLLTLVYGLLYYVSHDWRPIAWAGIVAYAAAVALTAELLRRKLGWFAWAFAATALTGSLALVYDVGFALATPWALAFVALAGLVMSAGRPRPLVAGILLGLGALVRLEVLILLAVIGAILVLRRVAPGSFGAGPWPRSYWGLLMGFAALPIMCVHDLLLTGDPLFWTTVAVRYSSVADVTIRNAPEQVGWLIDRYSGLWPLTALAIVGVVELVRQHRWQLLVGVFALGAGTAALLVVLAARAIYVPSRYAGPIDLAAIVAAAAGANGLVGWAVARAKLLAARAPRAVGAVVLSAGLAVCAGSGLLLAWPSGIFSAPDRARITNSRAVAIDWQRVRSTVLAAIDATPGVRDRIASVAGPPALLVPTLILPGTSLDLDVPLTNIGATDSGLADPAAPRPGIGQLVFHDRHVDGRIPALEVDTTAPFGASVAVPLQFDRSRGYWVVAIRSR